MKNSSDTIRNQTRNHPACSRVPRQTAPPHAGNKNAYKEYFLGGKGSADCLEIWEPQPPETLRVCIGLYWDCFTFSYRSLQNNNGHVRRLQ